MMAKAYESYQDKEAFKFTIVEGTKEHLDHALGLLTEGDKDKMEQILFYLTGEVSTGNLREFHAYAILRWMDYKFHLENKKASDYWLPSDYSYEEAEMVFKEFEKGSVKIPDYLSKDKEKAASALFGDAEGNEK